MAEKQTLEELAQLEVEALRKRERAREEWAEGGKRLAVELPDRFLTLARQVREGVMRFNSAAPVPRPVQYTESAAVTTRDTNVRGDFNIQIKRAPNEIIASLREMSGSQTSAFLIEASGHVGVAPSVDRFRLRVDALWKDGAPMWRLSCDGKPLDIAIDELGERMVMVVVTGQLARLWNVAPWVGPTRI